ncbi:MAG: nucleotidyltransferase domain-containing protein [Deltaproteobacteria bacterium]|nr:nucleotidyltransferase domain-containing protein [Deltaproteobacteria bacterium]
MDQEMHVPPEIFQGINLFMEEVKQSFGDDLVAAVLFGSAAEGRLRITSDVNLLLVLRRFDREQADKIRETFRDAHASIRLDVMFLLSSEIEPAMDAFAVKFADILSRRRILFGSDPFAHLVIQPESIRRRTRQVLLNLILRLRERYTLISLREEQLVRIAADTAGPIRACAASILMLEGRPAASSREALAAIVSPSGDPQWSEALRLIDVARREGALPPGTAGTLIFSLLELAESLYRRLDGLSVGGEEVTIG